MLDRATPDERQTPVDAYFLALVLSELGDKDRALAALEQAYQGRTALMAVLKIDPRIDGLRDDRRFADLLRRMNFPP